MASLYQQYDSGFYWIKYRDPVTRRIVRKSLRTKNKKYAEYQRRKYADMEDSGVSPMDIAPVRLSVILDLFFKEKRIRNRPETARWDEYRIKDFLRWSGISRMDQINEAAVIKFIDYKKSLPDQSIIKSKSKRAQIRQATGFRPSVRTLNYYITNLKTFLNWSVRNKHISVNPLLHMGKLKSDRKPPKFIEADQFAEFMRAARKEVIFPAVMVFLYTGMRPSELRRLQWKDIDRKKNIVLIRKAKSGTFRVAPLHPELKEFIRKDMFPLKMGNLKRCWKRVREATRMDIRFYDLRHTFASHLVMAGVDLPTVKELMGHQHISTTMVYSHLADDHVKQSIGKLNFGHNSGHNEKEDGS